MTFCKALYGHMGEAPNFGHETNLYSSLYYIVLDHLSVIAPHCFENIYPPPPPSEVASNIKFRDGMWSYIRQPKNAVRNIAM